MPGDQREQAMWSVLLVVWDGRTESVQCQVTTDGSGSYAQGVDRQGRQTGLLYSRSRPVGTTKKFERP